MAKAKSGLKALMESEDFKSQIEALTFEEAMTLVEELVESVERGDLPLDRTVRAYERGAALIARMRSLLKGAEKKLEVLEIEGS